MVVVTVVRKETKSDGTLITTTEKQQRDDHGTVLKILSKTTETRRSANYQNRPGRVAAQPSQTTTPLYHSRGPPPIAPPRHSTITHSQQQQQRHSNELDVPVFVSDTSSQVSDLSEPVESEHPLIARLKQQQQQQQQQQQTKKSETNDRPRSISDVLHQRTATVSQSLPSTAPRSFSDLLDRELQQSRETSSHTTVSKSATSRPRPSISDLLEQDLHHRSRVTTTNSSHQSSVLSSSEHPETMRGMSAIREHGTTGSQSSLKKTRTVTTTRMQADGTSKQIIIDQQELQPDGTFRTTRRTTRTEQCAPSQQAPPSQPVVPQQQQQQPVACPSPQPVAPQPRAAREVYIPRRPDVYVPQYQQEESTDGEEPQQQEQYYSHEPQIDDLQYNAQQYQEQQYDDQHYGDQQYDDQQYDDQQYDPPPPSQPYVQETQYVPPPGQTVIPVATMVTTDVTEEAPAQVAPPPPPPVYHQPPPTQPQVYQQQPPAQPQDLNAQFAVNYERLAEPENGPAVGRAARWGGLALRIADTEVAGNVAGAIIDNWLGN